MLNKLLPRPVPAPVRAEQIRLLYHQGVPIQLLGIVAVIVSASAFWKVADHTLLVTWAAVQIVIYLIRVVSTIGFEKVSSATPAMLERWGWIYVAGTFLSGVAWGMLSMFLNPLWSAPYQIMLCVIFTGIIAVSFITNSSLFVAFPAFYLPPVLFLSYNLLAEGNEGATELAFLTLIYVVLMYVSALQFNTRLAQSLEIRFENEQLAAELAQSNLDLSNLAEKDELTGLANRRAMNRYLASEWKRHHRAHKPLSLLYIDLDCFKQYNDHYGHEGGDHCLIRLAEILMRHAHRSYDMAARFGGEEFALILPETPKESAMNIALALLADLEDLRLPHAASRIASHVTMSIGIATLIPDQPENDQPLRLSADRALYHAKNTGRNRACSDGSDCRQALAA